MSIRNAIYDTLKSKADDWLADPGLTREVFNDVLDHLARSGVFVPDFRHRIHHRFFGSYFTHTRRGPLLHLGCYPTLFSTEWFVMHEVGHVLWYFYEPCRKRAFKRFFGSPAPDDYDDIHAKLSWRGPLLPDLARPQGEPSPYGAEGGGEERFCELIGLMYARGGFDRRPPRDLRRMWSAAWDNGLARMTRAKVRNG